MKIAATVSLVIALAVADAGWAHADALPAGTGSQDAASKGQTDVANSGQFETAAKKSPEKDPKNVTEAQILGGGLLATGNSRSLAVTGSGQFRSRLEANQISAVVAVNYAESAVDPASRVEPTVENYQGKLRYDRFVTDDFALFLAVSARRDRFQELNLRLNVDPGAAYYFVDQGTQQLWGELGYDFQFDMRRQEAIDAAVAKGESLDRTAVRHSGRLFTGYHDAPNDVVSFATGLEYLQSVSPDTKSWRLNWDASLTSKIGGNFSLATTFSLKYDHNPLPGVKNTDTMSAVSLVYQLL